MRFAVGFLVGQTIVNSVLLTIYLVQHTDWRNHG